MECDLVNARSEVPTVHTGIPWQLDIVAALLMGSHDAQSPLSQLRAQGHLIELIVHWTWPEVLANCARRWDAKLFMNMLVAAMLEMNPHTTEAFLRQGLALRPVGLPLRSSGPAHRVTTMRARPRPSTWRGARSSRFARAFGAIGRSRSKSGATSSAVSLPRPRLCPRPCVLGLTLVRVSAHAR